MLSRFILLLISFCNIIELVAAQKDTNGIRGEKDRALQTVVVGKIDQFILYNAMTDQPLLTLSDGMIVNTAALNATSFNIEATTVDGAVGSVEFGYNGRANIRREGVAPYALCGNNGANYYACSYLVVGPHTITATSYSGSEADGTVGSVRTVSFRIVHQTSMPTKSPTKFPIKATVITTKSPTKVQTKAPLTAAPVSCNIPKVNINWQSYTPDFPLNSPEAQTDLVGNDLVIFGGFSGDFRAVTNLTYARDISVPNSPWRRMEDMPVMIGITHAATVVINMKIYMCGGYVGPPPGPHTSKCFIYDHSKLPGTGQWSNFTTLPKNGTAGGGMIYDTVKNALYYSGGAQRPTLGSREAIDKHDTWKFSFRNPSLGWFASTPIPYKANHQSCVTVPFQGVERHFFAGGQLGENELNGNVADLFEFIASDETWVRRASMPYGRGHTTTSTRAYGCGFIMAGGAINSFTTTLNRTSDVHYYHIPFNNWTKITSLQVRKATPKVFMDEANDFIYFVDSTRTSRLRFSN